MNKRTTAKTLLLSLMCFIASCSSTPTETTRISPEAFNSSSRYALLWVKPCHEKLLGGCTEDDQRTTEAKYVVHGNAEQIDLKQEYEDSVALSASIARLNADRSMEVHYLATLRKKLKKRSMNVVTVANPLSESLLKKRSSKRVLFDDIPLIGATQFPLQLKANVFDFTSLYQRLGVDYLVVMELLKFSVEQHFGPTGQETGNPQVVTAVRLYVHEKATDKMVFDDYSYKVAIADDGWDNPPHYETLEAALMQSLEQSINGAANNLLR